MFVRLSVCLPACINAPVEYEQVNSVSLQSSSYDPALTRTMLSFSRPQIMLYGSESAHRPLQRFECMTTLAGHTGEVRGVAISTSGDYIVTGSADGTVK
jgi:WD40 repeat protein